jgi:hypothetical protein
MYLFELLLQKYYTSIFSIVLNLNVNLNLHIIIIKTILLTYH